ncbi:MAG: pyruvate:ferredoxin (flavodoxin) oxidoreductase [Cellulosilyticaceae bacterium]
MLKKMMTIDGNTAAAYIAYAFTDVATIYPIAPSSNMGEEMDGWAAKGAQNIFGQTVNVVEMQSEVGAAGALHGSLQVGALATTFTASQGLLLMMPNMYKVAGELLPAVFHVSARAIAAQALSIYGDHQDVMAVRQTGCALLASGSVQEILDIAPVAHLAAIKGRLPFVHFFDGFRTSHEIQKVEVLDYKDYEKLIDTEALDAFRKNGLSPTDPVARGTVQNSDIYFQTREASNKYYDALPKIVEDYMNEINKLTGRDCGLFNYYGDKNAEYIIVAMGSVTETIEETIDSLNEKGEKYGLVKVHLYRPFSREHLLAAIPESVRKICVMDRTKEPGALGEPLYIDVCSAFYQSNRRPKIIGGRYGLGSKDVRPTDIKAVFENLKSENAKNNFTVGITDDVTNKSIEVKEEFKIANPGTINCKFWGLSSDGTVGANKQAIKIIGNYTSKHVQAYFVTDSKKSEGMTVSHLRFGDDEIKSTYLIDAADYIACHRESYVKQYDVLKGLKKGGVFVLNSGWDLEELTNNLPAHMKRFIAKNEIKFYTIDARKIAVDIGLGKRINMIMQSAFFKITNIIPIKDATNYLNNSIDMTYKKKGLQIIRMNYAAVSEGQNKLVEVNVPKEWLNAEDTENTENKPEFIKNVVDVMKRQDGDTLPVSTFNTIEDGTFPQGTTVYEKRGLAVNIPEWDAQACTQCNTCSSICPHASIRPFLLTEKELKNVNRKTFKTNSVIWKMNEESDYDYSKRGWQYRIQVSPLDCTGCGNCVDMCPAPTKAIKMVPLETQLPLQADNWNFVISDKVRNRSDYTIAKTIKDSQFKTPYIQFSNACSGCGETPYIKLVTQLFGDRMIIANATGCSSIWGATPTSIPYCKNSKGHGPAWANSLVEDNAEYGYGMAMVAKQMRDRIERTMKSLLDMSITDKVKEVFTAWIEAKEDSGKTREVSEQVEKILNKVDFDVEEEELVQEIRDCADYLVKRSHWIVGGDGWAYDIGYGGLDHVMASGENINVLVFDTEMYSDTGGHASKSTPSGATAKFEAGAKNIRKKDLGMMLMSYGNAYVAQVAIGADREQLIKALYEAEEYNGPSIIICYAPCIAHGLKCGMGQSIRNMYEAVRTGYWHLYRYNPENRKNGKNPFILDSKEPYRSFKGFLMGQARYLALEQKTIVKSTEMYAKAEEDAKYRYQTYKHLAEMY